MTSDSSLISPRLAGFAAIMFLAACAAPPAAPLPPPPQSYVVLMPNDDGTVGQLNVSSPQGEVVVREARQGVNLDGSLGAPYAVDENRIKRDFAQAIAASPPPPVSFMLYYELGGTQLTAESQALIPRILEAVKRRPAPDVSVIGHTDTVGTPELNEKLGLQRALSVAELISKAGLKAHDLTIVSHGERNLLVRTPDETPEPRNRRVEITVR
jgi:peptidoglycan-associated lipoprotein